MTGPTFDDLRSLVERYDRVGVDSSGAYICAKLQGTTYRIDLVAWEEGDASGCAHWATFMTSDEQTPRATADSFRRTTRVR